MAKFAFRGCRFCGGRGCLACPGEQEKAAMEYSFNNPLLVIHGNPEQDPLGWELLKAGFSREVVEKAFTEGNGSEDLQAALDAKKAELGLPKSFNNTNDEDVPFAALHEYLRQLKKDQTNG